MSIDIRHPAGAGQRPAERHPADRLGGDVHLHRLPDHRHPAGGAARLRARRPRLRLGAGRPGDQPAVLATLLARPYAGARHRRPGRSARCSTAWPADAASGLFMLLSVAIQGWPALSLASLLVGRPGTRRGGKPGRLGGDRLGHRPGRRATHRQGDFLERHRQLRAGALGCCWCSGWGCGAWARPSSCSGHSASPQPGRSCRRRWCTASDCRSTMCSAGSPRTVWAWRWGDRLRHHRHLHHLYYASRGWPTQCSA